MIDKVKDCIFNLMEDIVLGFKGAFQILVVCIIGTAFILTMPIWIIPYVIVKRHRS